MALLKLLPDLDFLGRVFKASYKAPTTHSTAACFGGGDSKPSVKPGGAYDGSDINPEDSCHIWGNRGGRELLCRIQEMGATEWEKNWWRDMKTQQEALNKKAAIEQARGDSAEAESRTPT